MSFKELQSGNIPLLAEEGNVAWTNRVHIAVTCVFALVAMTAVTCFAQSGSALADRIEAGDRKAALEMIKGNASVNAAQPDGTTPLQWLLNQRLARARRLLETTDRAVEWIALEAGFGSAVSLRQHFAASLGTSPTRYRARFQAN